MNMEIRWFCVDCLKYVRPYRELPKSEAGERPMNCQNSGCSTGYLNLIPIQVPASLPANLSNPVVDATHDDMSGPGPGYRPSILRRVMRWFGWAGVLSLCLAQAQDLSSFKGKEFSVRVYPPCAAGERGDCTHDADTPKVQVAARGVSGNFSLRLRGIDAPELAQPRGTEAMEALFRMLAGERARVYVEGRDKYGRTLAVLYTEGGADINALLVANGYAWVDSGRMPKDRRRQLEAAQATARERRLGLWADGTAIAPWEWRKGKR